MVAKRLTYCLIAFAAASLHLPAQTRVSLQQAASRQAQTYAPSYDGQRVIVQGVVAAPMVRVRDYSHLVIQDETRHGLTLEGSDDLLGGVRPGDHLELEGEIHNSAGLPVLLPSEIR